MADNPPIELAEPSARDDAAEASVLFVGTATTVISYAGFTVLTDPNFLHRGQRAFLGKGLTAVRLTDPALRVDELPPLDVMVLSHLHGDHFDRVARRGLPHELPVVTTGQAARRLRRYGFEQARALATWDTQTVRRGAATLQITALPARHAFGVVERLLPPVIGSLLEFRPPDGDPLRIYVSGDTLVHDELADIRRRHPDIDLAILHLGGTRIFGLLVTMDGAQGVQALRLVQPRQALPVHYDDYKVFRSPLRDFRAALEAAGLDLPVSYLARGESLRWRPQAAG